jgi:hypothetical protein
VVGEEVVTVGAAVLGEAVGATEAVGAVGAGGGRLGVSSVYSTTAQ